MKWLIWFSLISFVIFPTNADEAMVLSLLKRDLGEMIEVKSKSEIWYCPDNTCEMYKIKNPHHDFTSFIYLHLFYESGYIYLSESIGGFKAFRKVAVEEPKVKNKVAHYCHTEYKSPKCILEGMRQILGIVSGFGRFDEGYFCYGYTGAENICKKL